MVLNLFITAIKVLGTALAALIALVLLLLPVRVGVGVRFDSDLVVLLRVGVFRINLLRFLGRKKTVKIKPVPFTGERFGEFPASEETDAASRRKKPKKAAEASEKPEKGIHGELKKAKKRSIGELLELLTDILRDASERLGAYATLRVRKLYVTAAAPEAADTAVLFGTLNAAVGTLLHVCGRYRMTQIDTEHLGVYADFTATKPRLSLDAELYMPTARWIALAFSAIKRYITV